MDLLRLLPSPGNVKGPVVASRMISWQVRTAIGMKSREETAVFTPASHPALDRDPAPRPHGRLHLG